jgi:hypothetical protein
MDIPPQPREQLPQVFCGVGYFRANKFQQQWMADDVMMRLCAEIEQSLKKLVDLVEKFS